MRTAFKDEEELVEADHLPEYDYDQPTGRELSLSSTTLLAIFFGLVLVCGLCFGLGYTLGRRATSDSTESASTVQAAWSLPVSSQPKPSAGSPYKPVQPEVEPQPPAPQVVDSTADDTPPEPTPAVVKPAVQTTVPAPEHPTTPTVKPALQPASAVTTPQPAAGPAPVTAPVPAPVPAGIMVQIAAVSNPADAAVLVSALQKHGYSAITRREAADTLTHVQVGPFASRAEANVMRQKLQADGYNAFLK